MLGEHNCPLHCTRNGHVHIDCAHHKPNLAHHIYIYINRKGNRKPTFCKPVAQSEKESTGPTASTSKTQSLATSNVRLTHVVKHEMSEVCMKWNTQKPTVCSVIQEHSHIKCKQARQIHTLNTTKPIHWVLLLLQTVSEVYGGPFKPLAISITQKQHSTHKQNCSLMKYKDILCQKVNNCIQTLPVTRAATFLDQGSHVRT